MIDLRTLNPPQREAVTHLRGPALVLAGAGSGKTRVITFRVAWLIEQGVSPANILGVTFTNKAANEMRERLAHLIAPDIAGRVQLSTFHSLGNSILREDIERLGYRTPFTIVDDGDQHRIINAILGELKLSGSSANPAALLATISRAKSALTTPAKHPDARYNPAMPRAQRIFDRYNQALKNLNAVDFDDLISLPTRLLSEYPELSAKYRDRFRYVMVDEYQDTNPAQLRLLEELVGPPDYNLMVVGDDDQSIYAFRGAVSEYILNFERYFANTRVIALEQNYRSVGSVLSAANAVIANNATRRQKTLWSELGAGEKIDLVEHDTDVDEAEWIATSIDDGVVRQGRRFDDYAILVRSNGQARTLEEALRVARIPYRLIGGQSLFDKKESRDVVAYLRLLVTTRDELAVRRVVNYPARQIGTETLAKLDARAQSDSSSMWNALKEACDDTTLPARTREGIRQFVALVENGRKRLRAATRAELGEVVRDYIAETGLASAIRTQVYASRTSTASSSGSAPPKVQPPARRSRTTSAEFRSTNAQTRPKRTSAGKRRS
jgi:DNA helicase-2/ATP-dependent DNA helicase PcrA